LRLKEILTLIAEKLAINCLVYILKE
jgi:hypothetical protein